MGVYQHMDRDISVLVARLVLLLQEQESYNEFLGSREMAAQELLNLLQDVSPLLPI
jgi:hypothetical protein